MITAENVFFNHFASRAITNFRLLNYTGDTYARITAANTGGEYDVILNLLDNTYKSLNAELGGVDSALTVQMGKTLTVDQFIAAFKLVMSDKEGVIADKLGGRNTAAYVEFYPRGITEYSNATKTEMATLTNRLNTAATKHATALGAALADQLSGFEGTWNTVRTAQVEQKAAVTDNRSVRTAARIAVEMANLTAMHTIAAKFPGDVEQGKSFFNFSLLYSVAHTSKEIVTYNIAPGVMVVAFNKSFTDNMKLEIKNNDNNSALFAYLAPTATTPPNGMGKRIAAGKGIRPKPSKLGDLNNTFLIIKNLSEVNEGNFTVIVRE